MLKVQSARQFCSDNLGQKNPFAKQKHASFLILSFFSEMNCNYHKYYKRNE